MNEHNGTTIFLNGQVGIGKTFFYNMIIATFHALKEKMLYVLHLLVFLFYKNVA
jgi:tRNA A37 threonylcarbamoyladenosine biosynthesis protein TsaE